jgi:SAM-dependent methyltransferase
MMSQYGGHDYREFVAEFYDTAHDTARPQDISFYIDYARESGGRTLEVGCGTGRVLIPTAAADCDITGLDLSPHMLRICREKLAEEHKNVQKRVKLIEGNMTDFATGDKYNLATIPFRPFQHLLAVAQQKACLTCIRHHLARGGKLVFDVFNPDFERLIANPRYTRETVDLPPTKLPDGRMLSRNSRTAEFHREQQYNDYELIYYVTYPDGKTDRLVESFPLRYYFRYEMEHLLELCGFKIIDLFGDFDRSAYSEESREMIFIAENPGD